jgi:hypothetical protein
MFPQGKLCFPAISRHSMSVAEGTIGSLYHRMVAGIGILRHFPLAALSRALRERFHRDSFPPPSRRHHRRQPAR